MIAEHWLRPDEALPNPTAPAPAAAASVDPRWYHRRLPDYRPTPLHHLPDLASTFGVGQVLVKHESSRFGLPSFKGLGASWAAYRLIGKHLGRRLDDEWTTVGELRALLVDEQDLTLVTATDGNHGRAVARMAALFGMSAHIYVPAGTTRSRIDAIQAEGAMVEDTGTDYDTTVQIAASTAGEQRLVLSDTSWPGYEEVPSWISQGYSTLFHEIDSDLTGSGRPAPDVVLVPVGVGALAAAAVRHYADRPTRIIAVEPVGAECITRSLHAGSRITVPGPQASEMVGLNCGTPSYSTWPELLHRLSGSIVIDDEPMHLAMRLLADHGIAAGETGAATLGGLIALRASEPALQQRFRLSPTDSVLLLCTEGVTDPVNYLDVVGRTADEVTGVRVTGVQGGNRSGVGLPV